MSYLPKPFSLFTEPAGALPVSAKGDETGQERLFFLKVELLKGAVVSYRV